MMGFNDSYTVGDHETCRVYIIDEAFNCSRNYETESKTFGASDAKEGGFGGNNVENLRNGFRSNLPGGPASKPRVGENQWSDLPNTRVTNSNERRKRRSPPARKPHGAKGHTTHSWRPKPTSDSPPFGNKASTGRGARSRPRAFNLREHLARGVNESLSQAMGDADGYREAMSDMKEQINDLVAEYTNGGPIPGSNPANEAPTGGNPPGDGSNSWSVYIPGSQPTTPLPSVATPKPSLPTSGEWKTSRPSFWNLLALPCSAIAAAAIGSIALRRAQGGIRAVFKNSALALGANIVLGAAAIAVTGLILKAVPAGEEEVATTVGEDIPSMPMVQLLNTRARRLKQCSKIQSSWNYLWNGVHMSYQAIGYATIARGSDDVRLPNMKAARLHEDDTHVVLYELKSPYGSVCIAPLLELSNQMAQSNAFKTEADANKSISSLARTVAYYNLECGVTAEIVADSAKFASILHKMKQVQLGSFSRKMGLETPAYFH